VTSRVASRSRGWAWWTLVLAPLYVLSCTLAEGGLTTVRPWGDVDQYERYGRLMLNGQIPYHNFYVEYPPGALLAFVTPAIFTNTHAQYLWLFKLVMTLCGLAVMALMARCLVALGADARRFAIALGAFAISPLALGHVFLNRFDLWPTLLTVAALTALLVGREVLSGGLLALDFAAKVFAAALVPVAAIRVWRAGGRRRLERTALSFAVVSLIVFLPFLGVAFGGLGNSYYTQAKRSLQIETVGSSLLLAGDRLGFHHAPVTTNSPGSIDLGGGTAHAVGAATTLLQVALVLLVAALYRRGPESDERLVTAFASCVAAFAVFGKVLSPQFLIWLAPLIPLVGGKTGRRATAALMLALVLTNLELRGYVGLSIETWAVWTLLVRNAVLVLIVSMLVWRLARDDSVAVETIGGSQLEPA